MSDVAPGASGMHPGKPVIWPTSKSSAQQQQQINSPENAQTAGGVKNVPARTAQAQQTSAATMSAQTTATASATPAAANVARALTIQDIRAHLLNIQIPDNDVNMRMAQLMLKYGLELSRSNFVKLMTMMEGTNMNQNVQEAAIALLLKGIDSPEALQILAGHFAENPQMAAQILSLQEGIANLQGALGMGKAALNSSLIAQIGAMLTQFDELLKGLPGKYNFTEGGSLDRGALMNDVRALKALLQGVQDQAHVEQGGGSEVLQASLSSAMSKLDGVLQNLVAQTIMSQGSERQEVNYDFYQIPNSLATPPKNLEVIVRKDSNGTNTIDPRDTQVIMSIETHNMGKISIVMRVKDKKASFLFNTENKEIQNMIIRESGELKQKLLDRDYVAEGFQVAVNPTMCHIRPYMIPLIGVDNLLRINVEA